MLNCSRLDTMSRIGLEEVDKSKLINIQEVKIDTSQPAPIRMLRYLEQVKNPYCFLCGETPVKINFSSEGGELSELLKRHFIHLKQ